MDVSVSANKSQARVSASLLWSGFKAVTFDPSEAGDDSKRLNLVVPGGYKQTAVGVLLTHHIFALSHAASALGAKRILLLLFIK